MFVRKAKIEDSESITSLLMLATGEVIMKFIGKQDFHQAHDFLYHFVSSPDNQYSFQNCFVIEEKGEILGALLGYDGAKLSELRQPVLEYIHQHFNLNFKVEDETEAGEYYIDSVGVSPNHQGKGIGSRLIQFVIDELGDKLGQPIGLLVDKTNLPARRLYLKMGFESVKEKNLCGIPMEHLQRRSSSK